MPDVSQREASWRMVEERPALGFTDRQEKFEVFAVAEGVAEPFSGGQARIDVLELRADEVLLQTPFCSVERLMRLRRGA